MNRVKRLQIMAYALISAALLSSLLAYLFLPLQQAEPFYMMSLVLIAMALFCRFPSR
jgi:hypothetical protein